MKNIHILPTDKPSRLFNFEGELIFTKKYNTDCFTNRNKNIYITSDEEIKEGDYWIYICPIDGIDYGDDNNPIVKNNLPSSWFEKLHDKINYKKIIITTDQDLIKDGVQAIPDEFLEWFVKNQSCEFVKIDQEKVLWENGEITHYKYQIIIPKEEPKHHVDFINKNIEAFDEAVKKSKQKPKQETLEEYGVSGHSR